MRAQSTYAVVWRERGGQLCAGRLELRPDALRLAGRGGGGSVTRELAYAELCGARIGRSSEERLEGLPALVLTLREGGRLLVGSITGLGALIELTDRLVSRLDRERPLPFDGRPAAA